MEFIAPNFLWALGLVIVPIIIHLFNFRKYKTVYFSDVRFLKEVKEETRKRSTLKHLLILISRILAICALVLAFAQPYVPSEASSASKTEQIVSIYVDNSFSMDATGQDGSYLEMARQMAVELVEHYGADVKFQLLTNNLSGNESRILNKDAMLSTLDELTISSRSRTIPEIIKQQSETVRKHENHDVKSFMISDFQTKMLEESDLVDSLPYLSTIRLSANHQYNLSIDSAWFETPVRKLDAIEILKVRVNNLGDSIKTARINAEISGSSSSTQIIIPADTSAIGEIRFTNKKAGNISAKVYLNAPEQMHYDDTLYFSYEVLKQINVLEVFEGDNGRLSRIFVNDSLFEFEATKSSSYQPSSLNGKHIVIVNGIKSFSSGMIASLKDFVSTGGSLMLFPAEDINLTSYNKMLNELNAGQYQSIYTGAVGTKPLDNSNEFIRDVFEKFKSDVDLPTSKKHYPIASQTESSYSTLYELFSGSPLINKYKAGAGSVYVSSVGLSTEFGNLGKHWLFVTTAVRAAQLSYPRNDLFYLIGGKRNPEIIDKGYNTEVNFILEKGLMKTIPLVDRSASGVITLVSNVGQDKSALLSQAGVYKLTYDGTLIDKIAYNFQRNESNLDFVKSNEELEDYLKDFNIKTLNIKEAKGINDLIDSIQELKPKTYWKTCLILALLFLAIEIALIKLWKH